VKKARRIPITPFSSVKRLPLKIVHRQATEVAQGALNLKSLGTKSPYLFVLNRQGQIVFASQNLHDFIPGKLPRLLLGLRPGEALGCIHAKEAAGGCGTSKACRTCGAMQAILSSLAGKGEVRDFRLTRIIGCQKETQQFLVMTSPFGEQKDSYTVMAVFPKGSKINRTSKRLLVARKNSAVRQRRT
jgi:hypothetical protein